MDQYKCIRKLLADDLRADGRDAEADGLEGMKQDSFYRVFLRAAEMHAAVSVAAYKLSVDVDKMVLEAMVKERT